MKKLFAVTVTMISLALGAWALPTDKQVLDLYQRWTAAVAGANDFNALVPMMSKASVQEIASQDVKQQQAGFGILKMAAMMGGGKKWTVEGHRTEKGMLLYKLVHGDKNNHGSTELPVLEEDGQLKVDLRSKK